jgi:hypothetical protein
VIQAQSMQTGEIMGKAKIEFIKYNIASLTVHGSRVWVHYPPAETRCGTLETQTVLLSSCPVYLYMYSIPMMHAVGHWSILC